MHANDNETKPVTNKWFFSLYIGFFAGLFWGGLKIVQHYFHFTSLSPAFLIEPFYRHSYLMTWQGTLLGWGAYILFSIAAAILYTLLLAKAKGPWYGLGYGLVWWAVLYLFIGPLTSMMDRITLLGWNTILTDCSLFLLWGLFIGYSISFEFTDERIREPFDNKRNQPTPH
ncbi:YqhR family membrane protein [Paenibacillus naphthalenovorans]|uniref:Membrane protein YqhR n=1 Tax=Paenibacillus naphthalenovorans TaxID=162209 RepID=A0A0U2VHE1_9BACL|nr:YqhR family membrane protein [Paenibacillus naphthalenovorans]ALS22883.1 hypothetical protein IJ22_25100 [Paenibacillus naphthalenovorans]